MVVASAGVTAVAATAAARLKPCSPGQQKPAEADVGVLLDRPKAEAAVSTFHEARWSLNGGRVHQSQSLHVHHYHPLVFLHDCRKRLQF